MVKLCGVSEGFREVEGISERLQEISEWYSGTSEAFKRSSGGFKVVSRQFQGALK